MKGILKIYAFMVAALLLAACSDDETEALPVNPNSRSVCYVLNSGDWKSNNSSLTMYDEETGETVQNYFELQNGRCLGNTANDMIVYGGKMYIAVAGESAIEVTTLDAVSVGQINCDAQPRYLAAHGGKVYATYYDGHVARIDTLSLEVEAKVRVGRNPEQLAVCGNRLYVANSGGMDYDTEIGYDNTVSVVDLASFSEVSQLQVVMNPANVVSDGAGVYVASYGNYVDVPSTLQYISPDGSVKVVEKCRNMTEMCFNAGVLYGFFSQYDEYWNATVSYVSYNAQTDAVESPWIKEQFLPSPFKISAAGDYVCVTSSDYINDGDAYLYNIKGELLHEIPAGLNPVKVVSLK